MAKEKKEAAQETLWAAQSQPPVHVKVVQEIPKPADPIPDFDRIVPGGCYFVPRGNDLVAVDAHGNDVDPGVLNAHMESRDNRAEA